MQRITIATIAAETRLNTLSNLTNQIDALAAYVRAHRDHQSALLYERPSAELERRMADARAALPDAITWGAVS